MILEKNNLQTAREWGKSYIEFIASYVHPKHSNHLRSHLRAIVALDHRRLIRPGKQNQAEFFCVWEVYFTKSCQQIWVRVNQPFIPFCTSQLRWNSTMRHCFYHTDHGQIFHNFAIQNTIYTHSMFRTIEARVGFWLNRLKNFQNHLYGQPFLTFAVRAVVECLN